MPVDRVILKPPSLMCCTHTNHKSCTQNLDLSYSLLHQLDLQKSPKTLTLTSYTTTSTGSSKKDMQLQDTPWPRNIRGKAKSFFSSVSLIMGTVKSPNTVFYKTSRTIVSLYFKDSKIAIILTKATDSESIQSLFFCTNCCVVHFILKGLNSPPTKSTQ